MTATNPMTRIIMCLSLVHYSTPSTSLTVIRWNTCAQCTHHKGKIYHMACLQLYLIGFDQTRK